MQNENSDKKVSIIVPVYNAKRYLDKCLSSLVEQTYKNIEIIVVDDGSNDGSGQICDRYAEKFSAVHCYHKHNGGAGQARNFGMDHSTGDYIMYVDADDYIAQRCVAEVLGIAEQYHADLVDFGKVLMLSAKNVFVDTDKAVRHFRSPQEVRQISPKIRKMIWGKLYTRELALSVRFNNQKRGEDACYMAEILERCTSMVKYNHCLYAYRAYQESLTRGRTSVMWVKRELERYRAAYDYAGSREQREEALRQMLLYCQRTAEDIVYRGEEAVSRKQLLLLKDQMDKAGQSEILVTEGCSDEERTQGERSMNALFGTVETLIGKAIETSQVSRPDRIYRILRNLFSRWMGRIKAWLNYEYKLD